MCLAVPARVISIDDQLASVEVQGVRRAASLMLLPEAAVGDYVLVDEEEVRAMEALRAEMQGAPRTVDALRTH